MTDPAPSVTLEDVRRAARNLRGVALRTPLLPLDVREAERAGGEATIWLKAESLQPVGSFKLRGAYHAIASLPPADRARGVVSYSSGNHAQGVARAARLLGIPATIVMPSNAPAIKVERVRADGAEVVEVGPAGDERHRRAVEIAAAEGKPIVSSHDDAAIIAGQGTVGLEIVEQIAEIDAADGGSGATPARAGAGTVPLLVLVPVGGGGLVAGIAVAVKSLVPDAVVVGVEPALAADARDSLAQGRIVSWPDETTVRTIADGQRLSHIGDIPFRIMRRHLEGIVTVEEVEIERAMARAARDVRLVLEPSGATALAAALFHRGELPPARRTVCVASGGNADPDAYLRLVAEGRAAGG